MKCSFRIADVAHLVGVAERGWDQTSSGAGLDLGDVEHEHDRALGLEQHERLLVRPYDPAVLLLPVVCGEDVCRGWALEEHKQRLVGLVLTEGYDAVQEFGQTAYLPVAQGHLSHVADGALGLGRRFGAGLIARPRGRLPGDFAG